MINFIKQKLIDRGYKKFLRKFFNPKKEFLNKSRGVFLSAVVERAQTAPAKEAVKIGFYRPILRYAGGVVASLMFATSGVAAYADQNNVGPESALYPFKKLSENVRLTLSSDENKVVLYEKFAERRVKEIEKIKISAVGKSDREKEEAEKIKDKLKEDFRDKIEKMEDGEVYSGLCKLELGSVANGDGETFWKRSKKLAEFKKECDVIKEKQIKGVENREENKENFDENSKSINGFENRKNNKVKEEGMENAEN